MSSALTKLFLAVIILLSISCKCTKYGCQRPCNTRDGKEIRYYFGAYYDKEGKVKYKLYVQDSTYSVKSQIDFDLFKWAVMQKKNN